MSKGRDYVLRMPVDWGSGGDVAKWGVPPPLWLGSVERRRESGAEQPFWVGQKEVSPPHLGKP